MRTLHRHPKKLTLLAWLIAAAVVLALLFTHNVPRFIRAWEHPHPKWLILVAGGAIAALLGYMVSYRSLMRFGGGPRIGLGDVVRIVAHGFGPFVPAGGFDVDKRAIRALHGDAEEAGLRVFAIGALELAVLAPAACVCAIILLVRGDRFADGSVLWPWALGVPIGFGVGFLFIDRLRRHVDPRAKGIKGAWGRAVRGAWMLADLARQPLHGWPALLGMAAYWAADIVSFYASMRFLGLHIGLSEAVLAYATGYALTRRSMPLGGAGITEWLLTVSLHWVGQPLMPSLAAVIVYRLFNFVLPAIPALWAHGRVHGLMASAYEADAAG